MLCGSMAVTLLGNSGVHAANELTEAIEDKSKEVTAVDEHDDKVENDDKGNENTELDTDKEYQYVAKEDITAQDPAKRSGSSFAVDVAKGLGTVALGVGMGIGADEGLRRIRKGSSGSEVSGETSGETSGKADNTEIEKLKSQIEALKKKLEEAEKNPTVSGNLLWGASAGFWGFIPALRDKVGDALGRDIDSKSKESIIAAVIAEIIGLSFAVWNISKMFGKAGDKPVGWKKWTYSVSKTATDVLLPPVGLILQCGEWILNGLLSLGDKEGDKELSEEERINKAISLLMEGVDVGNQELSEGERINKATSLLMKKLGVNGIKQALINTGLFNNDTIDLLIAANDVLTSAVLNTILNKINDPAERINMATSLLKEKVDVDGIKQALKNTNKLDNDIIDLLIVEGVALDVAKLDKILNKIDIPADKIKLATSLLKDNRIAVDNIKKVLTVTGKFNNDTIDLLRDKNAVLKGADFNRILNKIYDYNGFILNNIGDVRLREAVLGNPFVSSNSINPR